MADKTGYIIANLTQGTFDGVYVDDPRLGDVVEVVRSLNPGDIIVVTKLLDPTPAEIAIRGKVRWMGREHINKARVVPGIKNNLGLVRRGA
jgi:hypothetical protein